MESTSKLQVANHLNILVFNVKEGKKEGLTIGDVVIYTYCTEHNYYVLKYVHSCLYKGQNIIVCLRRLKQQYLQGLF